MSDERWTTVIRNLSRKETYWKAVESVGGKSELGRVLLDLIEKAGGIRELQQIVDDHVCELDDYDPSKEGKQLDTTTLRRISNYDDPRVNPDHVVEWPRRRKAKAHLMGSIIRYEEPDDEEWVDYDTIMDYCRQYFDDGYYFSMTADNGWNLPWAVAEDVFWKYPNGHVLCYFMREDDYRQKIRDEFNAAQQVTSDIHAASDSQVDFARDILRRVQTANKDVLNEPEIDSDRIEALLEVVRDEKRRQREQEGMDAER